MKVSDRSDNPYRMGTTLYRAWERAKRERFDITEAQLEFCLGSGRNEHPPERIA